MTLPFDKEWVEVTFKDGRTSREIQQTPAEVLDGVCGLLEQVLSGKMTQGGQLNQQELATAKLRLALRLLIELRSRDMTLAVHVPQLEAVVQAYYEDHTAKHPGATKCDLCEQAAKALASLGDAQYVWIRQRVPKKSV